EQLLAAVRALAALVVEAGLVLAAEEGAHVAWRAVEEVAQLGLIEPDPLALAAAIDLHAVDHHRRELPVRALGAVHSAASLANGSIVSAALGEQRGERGVGVLARPAAR